MNLGFHRRPSRGALAITGLLVLAAAIVFARVASSHSTSDPVTSSSQISLQADDAGSVITDGHAQVSRGYSRSGGLVWTQHYPSLLIGRCLASCPDFVLSGSLKAFNSTRVADPDVIWRVGSKVARESSNFNGRPGRKLVLAASSPDRAILAESGLGGPVQLEFRDRPHRSLIVPLTVTDNQVSAAADSDLSAALVLAPATPSASSGATALRWLTRSASGWSMRAVQTTQHFSGGCVSDDGSNAVLLSEQGSQLVSFGHASGTALTGGGNCIFDQAGPVVVSNSVLQSPRGQMQDTEIRQYDTRGTLLWATSLPIAATVSTSAQSTLVVAAGAGQYLVFGSRGSVHRRNMAADAVVTGAREIVTANSNGAPKYAQQ